MKLIDTSALTAELGSQPKYLRKIILRLAEKPNHFECRTGEYVVSEFRASGEIKTLPKSVQGGYNARTHLKTVCKLVAAILNVRKERRERRTVAPAPSFERRLEDRRRVAVTLAAMATVRWGAAGGYDFQVRVGVPGYEVTMSKNWDVYKGSFKGWAAAVDNHVITVPRNWLTQVRKKLGRGWADGCMVLAMTPFIEIEGRGIFEAVVAVQSRGFGVKVENRVLSTWPGDIVRVFKTLKQALADEPPKAPPPAELPPDTDEFLTDLAA